MDKHDFKKELKALYGPSPKEVSLIDVPAMNFLITDGQGDPNTSQKFQDAVGDLYKVSYTIKFMLKKQDIDYSVLPLESLWWMDNMETFQTDNKDKWKWTLMIMQPGFVIHEMYNNAFLQVSNKLKSEIRFKNFREGLCAQIMHIGPYSSEGPAIEKIHSFITKSGYKPRGKHHEIYLSDPRKSPPEKMKTVLRQPIDKE
ncbi:MAG: GyrI-like domain-containing protein [Eubacteriales bacterium]|jgi:hypothetical protein